MGTFSDIQIFILALGSAICFIIALFARIVEYKTRIRKSSLIMMEISTSLLLLADLLNYIYDGNPSVTGYWVVRISNFLLYYIVYVELLGLNLYVSTFLRERRKKLLIEANVINAVAGTGMGLVLASQFTGLYYTFDENNAYQRGPLFFVSFIAPLVLLLMLLFASIKNRKNMPKLIFIGALLFTILPLVSAFMQIFFYGTSLFNMSIGVSAITIFALTLVDNNNYLKVIASTDQMTGLPNSYGYILELDKLCESKEIVNYDAFYFDLVRLGLINRKYGNEVGDYVLKNYASIVRNRYMEKDEVLGRLGGNFFVAVVKKENTKKFLLTLSGVDIPLNDVGINDIATISAVAGVYSVENEYVTSSDIMARVSMAISIAKNIKKKPYVFLSRELMEELNEHRQLQEMIPRCLENREFIPFYQPKVDLETGLLCGAEALCRWNHEGEFIPPMRFVPIMERNESICGFDFYMLHRVCEDIKSWLIQGYNVPVISINFSRKNLGNPILAEAIYKVVDSYKIPLNLVQIEITETLDEFPLEYLKGVVEALQRYGLSAAIDDFGVGSSSLRLIKEVPFNVLKIDKSFVDSLTEKDCRFLKHIIDMAKESGASVITEGVEKKEQILVLRDLGCKEIQGFYFDRPMPEESFVERLINPQYVIG